MEAQLSDEVAMLAEARQKELLRRRRLGVLWTFISLAWWVGTVVPVVYVVANAGP